MNATGTRPVTAQAVMARSYTVEVQRSVSRKELSRASREAGEALRLRPALRLVLNELIAVWGETHLSGRLMVWPSNEHLTNRTGLSERAIRYCLAQLVEAGVIACRDSANGKRFAIRNKSGEVIDAFGFDLAPLYERQGEFAAELARRNAHREAQRRCFDLITICRRTIAGALDELPESAQRASIAQEYSELADTTPRRGSMIPIDDLAERWMALRQQVEDLLLSGYGGNKCRHIETDKESEINEQAPERELDASLVNEACPALAEYAGVSVTSTAGLVTAAEAARYSIGAHRSAWDEGVKALGPVGCAVALAIVLELYQRDVESGRNMIRNPGGYFRAYCRMVQQRQISLEKELRRMIGMKSRSRETPALLIQSALCRRGLSIQC